jgi:hypothetical protein
VIREHNIEQKEDKNSIAPDRHELLILAAARIIAAMLIYTAL